MQHTATLVPIRTAVRTTRRSRTGARPAIRIHARRGSIATGVVVALILAAIVVAALSLVLQPPAPVPPGWTETTVEPAGSLWTLAAAHPVEGLSTAETATLIAEENGLESAILRPGQIVRVPSRVIADTAVALR